MGHAGMSLPTKKHSSARLLGRALGQLLRFLRASAGGGGAGRLVSGGGGGGFLQGGIQTTIQ